MIEGWKPLCIFLNKPIPQNIPFPYLNATAHLAKMCRDSHQYQDRVNYALFVLLAAIILYFTFNKN